MKTDKFTLFVFCNFLVSLSTPLCSQNINKQIVNIVDKNLTDYSFLRRYHYTNSHVYWNTLYYTETVQCTLYNVHLKITVIWKKSSFCFSQYTRKGILVFPTQNDFPIPISLQPNVRYFKHRIFLI